MKQLTYREAYDKIIQAYFNDEIKPMQPKFCFCGTLAGGDNWGDYNLSERPSELYLHEEFNKMEEALLDTMNNIHSIEDDFCKVKYEDALFIGMSAALDVLKEIHRERGENVDEVPTIFKKRELVVK